MTENFDRKGREHIMNVMTILKNKGSEVFTKGPDATLNEITHMLNRHKIGSIVIVEEDGTVCGIVSERDIIAAIARKGGQVLGEPVRECMTRDVFTCSRDDTLEQLMAEMTTHRFRHLPVVENGKLMGLVSIGDVVKQRISEAEMEAAALRDYIATG